MVLSFALCASLAFAQTSNFANTNVQKNAVKKAALPTLNKSVDYKASIFTKAETVLQLFDFKAADTVTGSGYVYGSAGKMFRTSKVDGRQMGTTRQHNETDNYSYWQFVPDTHYVATDPFVSTYPNMGNYFRSYIMAYMGTYYGEVPTNNGFFLMSMIDQRSMTGGTFNAFLQLPGVAIDTNAVSVLDVEFYQFYEKYYDTCYIDYMIDGEWYSRQINIDGVDVEVNDAMIGKTRYTMPLALADQDTVNIRFRWFCDGSRGNAYGYVWAVDYVSLIAGDANRWSHFGETYLNGGYGTLPQGMQVPLTWYTHVANTGIENLTNIAVTVNHLNADKTVSTPVLTINCDSITAGNPTELHDLVVNEQGLYNTDSGARYQGWYGYSSTYGAPFDDSANVRYQGRSLPTTTPGLNFVSATISSAQHSFTYDTIAYRVVGATNRSVEEVDYSRNLNNVYVWAHDNGVIPSQSAYTRGFTDPDENGQKYVTTEGHFNRPGYEVTNRYTTGNVIPEGWRILGVEMIAATTATEDVQEFDGTTIKVVLQQDIYGEGDEANTVWTYPVSTGVSEESFEIQGDYQVNNFGMDEDDFNGTGYVAPGAAYKSVAIFFPEQPELEPNTSYRVGYTLESTTSDFAICSPLYRYANTRNEENDSVWYTYKYYSSTDALKDYVHQFIPNTYDIHVTDNDDRLWAGENSVMQPMIRLLVGPEVPLARVNVIPVCDSGNYRITYEQTYVCDTTSVVQGYNATFVIRPEGDVDGGYRAIDTVFVDGHAVTFYDPRTGTGDRNLAREIETLYDHDSNTVGERYIYSYTFQNIDAEHTLSASWKDYRDMPQPQSIDAVSSVSMRLYPNPATSQVRIALEGVSGMVNCNIIDMSGRVIYNADLNAESEQVVSLKNVPAGAYFVRVTNGDFSKIEKLIVR